MKRRLLIRVVAFLLLGAIVNVAVAWGCVWPANPMAYQRLEEFIAHGRGRSGFQVIRWHRVGHAQVERVFCDDVAENGFRKSEPPDEPRLEVLAGWPWSALGCKGTYAGAGFNMSSFLATEFRGDVTVIGGLYATCDPSQPSKPACAAFPLTPLWPGFAINTVFYAAVLWLLFAGPFVVRRWRRIRRGLCPKCAYDLRATEANICPECGATR